MGTKQIQTCLYGEEIAGSTEAPTRLESTLAAFHYRLEVEPYTIWLRPDTGYFEHNVLGDEAGGGLWFADNRKLYDYDGVFELPRVVIEALKADGWDMSYAEDV